MKKLKLFLLSLTAASTLMLQSCGGDDDANPKPTITFKTGTGYTASSKSVGAGQTIKIGILANGEETLKEVKLTRSTGGSPAVVFDSSFSSKTFNYDVDNIVVSNQINTTETYTIQVTDKNGETAESSITLTIVNTSQVAVRSVSLVGQDGSAPEVAWASSTASTYELADAKLNSSTVDVVYYYGSTNKATLSAPDNLADLNQIWSSSPDRPETWGVKNATRFRLTTMTQAQFDAIADNGSDEAIIEEAGKAAINDNAARNVNTTQIWIFKTAAGKLGVLQATLVPTSNTTAINFVAKYQQ